MVGYGGKCWPAFKDMVLITSHIVPLAYYNGTNIILGFQIRVLLKLIFLFLNSNICFGGYSKDLSHRDHPFEQINASVDQ